MELKFKFWDTKNKCWLTDKDNVYLDEEGTAFILVRGAASDYLSRVDGSVKLFTGRKDDFGIEIFEGDICRVLYTDWGSKSSSDTRTLEQYLIDISSIGVAERVLDKFEINFGKNRFDEFVHGSFNVGSHGKLKVIGNVHENPELLTSRHDG